MINKHDDAVMIRVENLGKCYRIYDNPKDRLKQAIWRGRCHYYREFWALRDVSFEVRRGETMGIIGRNGSGKSTLLQMICGTLTPTEGSSQTHGRVAALLELGSGFNPEFTGVENIYFNASLLGLSQKQIEARLDDIQAFADIGDFIHQPVKTYSSGMQVRLAFAVISHVEPSVLIVDEALSVGDAIFGQRCMRFIRQFIEKGTLLFVSHDLNAVSSLCDRAIWVDSGRVGMDAETAPILTAYTKFCLQSSQEELQRKEEVGKTTVANSVTGNLPSRSGSLERQCHANTSAGIAKESMLNQSEPGVHGAYDEIADWDSARDYGNKHAHIIEVVLLDHHAEATASPRCGTKVLLRITSRCHIRVNNFMAGFIVRNKTGLIVWGENNIGHGQLQAGPEESVEVAFEFTMPYLMPSTYSMSIAISEGEENQPSVMHYKPDAIILEPLLYARQVHGIFAISDMSVCTTIKR